MALNYGDNYVLKIKKGDIEYLVRDSIAEAAINTIQGNDQTEGSIAKALADAKSYAAGLTSIYDVAGAATTAEAAAKSYADGLAGNYDAAGTAATAAAGVVGASTDTADANTVYGAKTYAKGLVDDILGEDSATSTLATLKQVIQELNAPENQGGITGTFVDTVKADLAGLTKDDGNGGTTHATVKEYVDNAVSGASSNVSTAIAALDATPSQSAGTDGLALSLTQVDGVVTTISGSIAANTYDAHGAAAAVLGAAGDASTANTVYGAKAYADSKITALGASTITNGVLELAL